jgi:putative DNA primase/helicase
MRLEAEVDWIERVARDITRQLGGRWSGRGGECPCPAHDDRAPSLSVRVGNRGVLFHCFAGCEGRAVIAALLRRGIAPFGPKDACYTSANNPPTRKSAASDTRLAERLWWASRPAVGTIAARYLDGRSIGAIAPSLRFHARTVLGSGTEAQR